MCVLQQAITDKQSLIGALEDSDIERIQVYADVFDGSQVTSYIGRNGGVGSRSFSVVVLTKAASRT